MVPVGHGARPAASTAHFPSTSRHIRLDHPVPDAEFTTTGRNDRTCDLFGRPVPHAKSARAATLFCADCPTHLRAGSAASRQRCLDAVKIAPNARAGASQDLLREVDGGPPTTCFVPREWPWVAVPCMSTARDCLAAPDWEPCRLPITTKATDLRLG